MAEQQYKYRRADFGPLPVKLNHLTISLDFQDGFVEAVNNLDMTASVAMNEVALDAKDLQIVSVELTDTADSEAGSGQKLNYDYRTDKDKLIVKLADPVSPGDRFIIRTVTRCVPSDNILEGIYKDTTPSGAPQQYISQCQQWGFQRIMPIFDDCTAKCTMTTTIEADARYTHLISNGNISRTANPNGRPVPKPGDSSRQVITYENSVPMAPYLFLVAVGTWDELADRVTYPSGKTVRLEYLVPPRRTEGAKIPMEILKRSVLWIGATQDYEYTGDTYRTICMNKSNFGGMENVGNTTIVTDAALIDEHTTDISSIYAHAVIVHEFEHNQCGSETTMETPFDVWLNEAYTVDVERQFTKEVFDPDFIRLMQVDSIRSPLMGPLAIEDGGRAGRIVREGFNNPDELIDGVTYVKAAEVIRMLRLIIGPDAFHEAKTLYFDRYRHGNANTDQFFECFEEVSGVSLAQFKESWLYRTGYPKIRVNGAFDEKTGQYTLRFRQELQEGWTPFHLPVDCALVDENGRDVPGTAMVHRIREQEEEIRFDGLEKAPAFVSINRDYSFYGTLDHEDATPTTLARQALLDPNRFCRVEAFRRLSDRERIKLLNDADAAIDEEWLSLYGRLLSDDELPPALKAYFLRIDEQPLDRTYSTWFPELVTAKEKLMKTVNARYRDELVSRFHAIDTYRELESPNDGIEDRILKNLLLAFIAVDDTPSSHQVILDHLGNAVNITDRLSALVELNRSSCPERRQILEETYEAWHTHLSGYGNYLKVVAAGTQPDVWDMVEAEKARPTFDVNQPTWCRSLLVTMAANTKMIWTDPVGIEWIKNTVIWLAPVNDYTASRILNTFQQYRRLKPELQAKVGPALEAIRDAVPTELSPTIHGQAKAYLGQD